MSTPPNPPGYPPQGFPQGPPSGYGAPPPGYPPQYGPPGYPPPAASKTPLIVGGIVVTLALLVAGWFLFSPTDAEAGEVFLVPAASPGPDPFSTTPFAPPPDPALAKPADANAAPSAPPSGAPTQATSGAKPGLYGGTSDKRSCDPAAMVAFLGANPDKAQAWVDAFNADPSVRLKDGRPLTLEYIPHYVAGLTPITLMNDVRVTNHGFKNGRATPLQSVLQKGSAVLVDEYGVPRVKCYCGNPLLPPRPTSGTPRYSGPRWPDFTPNEIVVVTPPPEPIDVLIVVVPNDPSQLLEIPPGSGDPNLEVYLVDGPPPSPESFDDDYSEGPPTPPAAPAPRTPTPRAAAPPPRAVAPMPPAPTVDPYDCSVNDCDDDTEDYQAIEDAYESQEQCYVTDLSTARGGYPVSCSECMSNGGSYACD